MAKQSEEVFEVLKQAILSLQMRPGSVLQELEIAQNFGVSRTPAREALQALMREGLVVTQGRFYTVKQFAVEEVRSLYELREGLEIMSVRLAIQRASDAELDALEKAVLYPSVGGDTEDVHEMHLDLVRLSRNSLLEEQLSLILEKVTMISRILENAEHSTIMASLEEHSRILYAIKRRNTIIAEEEMALHIRSAAALYERHYRPVRLSAV